MSAHPWRRFRVVGLVPIYGRRRRSELHRMYIQGWELFHGLYDATLDEPEARIIRDLCEEVGLPMGYGRIGKAPVHLHDDYVLDAFPLRPGQPSRDDDGEPFPW